MEQSQSLAVVVANKRGILIRLAIGVGVLLVSVLAILLLQRDPPSRTSAIGARLELAAGEVTVKDGDRWPTVVSGVPLSTGAELATGKGARALVRLSDGSSLFLRSESNIKLEEGGVTVSQGEVWLDAPPSERGGLAHRLGDVTVSAADAGLSMRVDTGEVTVVVTRGLAVVTSPAGRAEANAGEQVKVGTGAAPKVAPLAYWDDWTGGMGDHRSLAGEGSGAGRIYGIDPAAPPGTPARSLEIGRQSVRAVLRDGLAETEVDQTFSNPGGRQVEGWYWFTVPERAIVTSFAVETDGSLVEGEVIERQEAAAQYGRAVKGGHEPALLEWIDGRSYRARIFPVPASGSRRVVLRYMELLSSQGGKLGYVYPMRGEDAAQIGEFSLSVDLGTAGVGMQLATLAEAVVEEGGRRVTMRRSGYTPRADFQLEVSAPEKEVAPLRVARFSAGGDRADYIMARYTPDLDWQSVKELPAEVAIVMDTSGSGDEAARQQKAAAAEAILRSLSKSDRFALIALDSTAKVLHPKEGLAEASDKEIAAALERLAEHASGGATDLGALFDAALSRVHGGEQPAIVYIGDGLATSGEVSGEKLGERLRRSLSVSRARFFTVAIGTESNHALLRELSRAGGGQPFRIDEVEMTTPEVLRLASAIKTPTITDLEIDLGAGLDEVLLTATGKVSRGEEVILLARTHHALPKTATVKGRLGGKDVSREHAIELERGVGVALVPRLWAAEKMRRILGEAADPEESRGKVVELGVEYGLMTPFTSILALESEFAYQQQGIKRRSSPLRGQRLTALDPAREEAIIEALMPRTAVGCMERSEPAPAPAGAVAAAPRTEANEPQPMPPQVAVATASPSEAFGVAKEEERAQEPNGAIAPGGGSRAKAASAGEVDRPSPAADLAPPAPPPTVAAPVMPMTASVAPAAKPKLAPGDAWNAQAPTAKSKQGAGDAADKKAREASPPPHAMTAVVKAPRRPASTCSDTARRPLAERIVVWSKRLRTARSAAELIDRYEGARSTCELSDWRAEQALLRLVQAKVRNEGAASELLAHFAGEPDTQAFIGHAILRRTVDPRVAAEVRRALFGEKVRWAEVDNELAEIDAPADRLARLRQVMLGAGGDPEGELRLVRLLAEVGPREEAVAYGRRLRDQGLVSPALAMELGDVLAAQGFQDEALRTYSEIVEFDPTSADSRRLLGDVFLRHGWYAPAYRQYKMLSDALPNEASSLLRMAAAAAGAGRVDEALRIQRQVASAEGTPGPSDPRIWARLWSAARLARLLAAPPGASGVSGAPSEPGYAESLTRKLKELQIFTGPAVLVLLTWEDLGASLGLAAVDGEKDAALGDTWDASAVGLTGVMLPVADFERLRWAARFRKDAPGRDVKFSLDTVAWDGKSFVVKTRGEVLAAGKTEAAL